MDTAVFKPARCARASQDMKRSALECWAALPLVTEVWPYCKYESVLFGNKVGDLYTFLSARLHHEPRMNSYVLIICKGNSARGFHIMQDR